MTQLINQEVKQYLNETVKNRLVPGISLAVYRQGQQEHFSCGCAQWIPTERPLTEDTLFDMASLTKVVSTTSLGLIALADGHFKLSDAVNQYLPQFPYADVSIQDLWAHTSGLAADDRRYRQAQTPDQLVDFICHLEKVYPTGKQVLYSDFNFILLGRIIEQFLGPLDEAFQSYIANPLGLKKTGYCPAAHGWSKDCAATEDEPDRNGVICGVVHDGKGLRMNGVSGNAGLFAPAKEMLPFVQMILQKGQYEGKTVIPQSTIELLKNRYTPENDRNRTLGWYRYDQQAAFGNRFSRECIFHTGFTGTSIYIDFPRDCAIILFTNRVHPSRNNNNIVTIRADVHNLLLANMDARIR